MSKKTAKQKELTKEEQLQKDLAEVRKELRSTSGKLERRDNRIEKMDKEMKDLKDSKEKVDKEIKDIKSKLKDKEKEIKEITTVKTQGTKELDKLNKSLEKITKEKEGLDKELVQIQDKYKKAEKDLKKLTETKNNSDKELKDKQEQIKKLEKELKDLKIADKDNKTAKEVKGKEIKELEDKIARLEKDNSTKDKEISKLEKELNDYKKKHKNLENSEKEVNEAIKKIKDTAKRDQESMQKVISKQELEIKALDEEATKYAKMVEDLNKELDKYKPAPKPIKDLEGHYDAVAWGILQVESGSKIEEVITRFREEVRAGLLPENLTTVEFGDDNKVSLGETRPQLNITEEFKILKVLDSLIDREYGVNKEMRLTVPVEIPKVEDSERLRRIMKTIVDEISQYTNTIDLNLYPTLNNKFPLLNGQTEIEVIMDELEVLGMKGNMKVGLTIDEDNLEEYNHLLENNPYTIEELATPVIEFNKLDNK